MMFIKASASLMKDEALISLVSGAILITSVFIIKRIPPLIPIIILGITLSLKGIQPAAMGPVALTLGLPGFSNLWTGFVIPVLPQIALTLGNAIVATEATGKMLYGDRAEGFHPKSHTYEYGTGTYCLLFIGGAPRCHGCGGLTPHHKLGAASEKSGYIIGITLIVLAVLFRCPALSIISHFQKES